MSAFGIPPANEVWHCEWRGCTSNRATNGPGTRPWRCVDCGCLLCDTCWDLAIAHQNGRVGREGIAHEKTDPSIQRVLQDILRPQFTAEQLDSLHEDDEETTWFGMSTISNPFQSVQPRLSNCRHWERRTWPTISHRWGHLSVTDDEMQQW
jgi:hypothetical protein